MTICNLCNGKGALKGPEPLIDPSSNTQSFQTPGPQQGATPCSQCRGTGIGSNF